jgi:hypothetical protein
MNNVTPSNLEAVQLNLEVIVSEDDKTVYVKFTGFENLEEADTYATYLTDNLPLMLFESEIKH